jgi:hypothetical protein
VGYPKDAVGSQFLAKHNGHCFVNWHRLLVVEKLIAGLLPSSSFK